MSHINTQAIRGKIGNTNYFLAKLKANQLTGLVKPAAELDEWKTLSVDEKFQRDPNMKRIKKDIAPYLANNPDRFYGALIVVALNGGMEFESIKDLAIGANIPNAYKSDAGDIGFLTLAGGTYVVLDGQHRLLALRQVVQGGEGGEGIEAAKVAQDDVTVIFIEEENERKTRSIFTVLNKYAKPTTAGQNVMMDENDGYAILSRKVLSEQIILSDKVNTLGSALPDRSANFTTLISIYEMTKALIVHKIGVEWQTQARPDEEEMEEVWLALAEYWTTIVEKIDAFSIANGEDGRPQELRTPGEPYSLLMKPVAQQALIDGLINATKNDRLTLENAIKRVNKIDWDYNSDIWKKVLVKGDGKIEAGKSGRKRAAALITYLIAGDKLDADELDKYLSEYQLGFTKKVSEDRSKWKQFPVRP
jgi:DNA sulfur modification protein DndB